MKIPTQGYIFGILLLCWAVLISYHTVFSQTEQHVPLVNRTANQTHSTSTTTHSITLDVHTLLNPKARPMNIAVKKHNNIFSPLRFPQSKKRIPRPSPKAAIVLEETPVSPTIVSPVDPVAQKAREAMAGYRFLGLVNEGDRTKVFLVQNQEIFIVGEGDKLKDDIRLVKIQPTSIRLQYSNSDIHTTIPISISQTLN